MSRDDKPAVWTEDQWPERCPNCGKASDPMGYWYCVEPYIESPDFMTHGACWDCGTLHPVMGRLRPEAFNDAVRDEARSTSTREQEDKDQ